ncbi:membrane dipeptidase (peptidase family M19) [Rhizobium sp. BK251]|nr:membrane dipeptidase (peptidase family M19) [Rhizobium sp. BK251]
MKKFDVFDGHNDAVQSLVDYKPAGRDFLVRSETGHLDLPRALEGSLAGGLFALHARPERQPENDLTITSDGYEVTYTGTVDPDYARRPIDGQLSAMKALIGRSSGQMRFAMSVNDIEIARTENAIAVVLHMEGPKRSIRN